MGNVYIGVNNKARKVSNIYVGVNNIARKVSKAYVGVSNKARLVYSSSSGVDPTKSEFTEAEVNALAAYGEINQVAVGSTFTIANTQDTNRTTHTYVVIGKDHKDKNVTNYPSEPANTGTVDVWATGSIASRVFKSSNPYGNWRDSDIRNWLNYTFYYGFNATTKIHLKQMTVEYYWTASNGNSTTMIAKGNQNTTDYVKLLSTTEFNPSTYDNYYYMHRREGNGYEYFPSVPHNETNTSNAKKRYASTTGTDVVSEQWRRSLCCYSTTPVIVYLVGSDGSINYNSEGRRSYGIVPCFRLGA